MTQLTSGKFYPKTGSYRIVKKFAWLPIRIGVNAFWLETVYIREVYQLLETNKNTGEHRWGWITARFEDKEKYERFISAGKQWLKPRKFHQVVNHRDVIKNPTKLNI